MAHRNLPHARFLSEAWGWTRGRYSSSLGAALTWGALLCSPPPGGAAALAGIGAASDSGVTLGRQLPFSPWEPGMGRVRQDGLSAPLTYSPLTSVLTFLPPNMLPHPYKPAAGG